MKRATTMCDLCRATVSRSSFSRHRNSKSCKNGGKNITRKDKYPWDNWRINDDLYQLPCGHIGSKKSCASKLSAAGRNTDNFRTYNLMISNGEKIHHSVGKVISEPTKKKLSAALRNYYQINPKQPTSGETRKKISESIKAYFDKFPEKHPNRRCAGLWKRMSYPEKRASTWLTDKGIKFEHNKRISRFYPDFVVNTTIIEIDGAQWHGTPEQMKRDALRDEILKEHGYVIFRISSKENIEERLSEIFVDFPEKPLV